MRYPEFLKEKGRIGFIAPSFGAATEPYRSYFESALEKFRRMGYETILGPNCYASCGIGKSNTSEKCAGEINDFFTGDRCDVIISCGGGETMCEDLPFVDFEAIKAAPPKWYIGYSDNTNLTFTLPVLCDTAAVYGPCVSAFGMKPWHQAVEDAFGVLTGKNLTVSNYDLWEREKEESGDAEPDPAICAPYHVTEPFHMVMHGAERAEFSGRLLGGCLDCLRTLCGTPYDKVQEFAGKYASDGIIWFLEACELTPMDLRRTLWQLDQAGWFKHAKGFLIGRPMMIDADGMGFDRFTAATGILEKYGVPIIMDLDIGHLPPMMPLISGAMADVTAELFEDASPNGRISVRMRME